MFCLEHLMQILGLCGMFLKCHLSQNKDKSESFPKLKDTQIDSFEKV